MEPASAKLNMKMKHERLSLMCPLLLLPGTCAVFSHHTIWLPHSLSLLPWQRLHVIIHLECRV